MFDSSSEAVSLLNFIRQISAFDVRCGLPGAEGGPVEWAGQDLTTKQALTQLYQCCFIAWCFLNVTGNPNPDYLCFKKSVPQNE